MDLNTLKAVKADEGATLQLVHPQTEEPLDGMTITLLGQDSAAYRKIQMAKQQMALNRLAKGKRATADLDAEKLAAEMIDDLAKLTVSWTGFELDGKALKCEKANAVTVYTDWPWIREQAQEFVANRANFFRGDD
jgi:hypothetical protein